MDKKQRLKQEVDALKQRVRALELEVRTGCAGEVRRVCSERDEALLLKVKTLEEEVTVLKHSRNFTSRRLHGATERLKEVELRAAESKADLQEEVELLSAEIAENKAMQKKATLADRQKARDAKRLKEACIRAEERADILEDEAAEALVVMAKAKRKAEDAWLEVEAARTSSTAAQQDRDQLSYKKFLIERKLARAVSKNDMLESRRMEATPLERTCDEWAALSRTARSTAAARDRAYLKKVISLREWRHVDLAHVLNELDVVDSIVMDTRPFQIVFTQRLRAGPL